MSTSRVGTLLPIAGLLTWAAAGLPTLFGLSEAPGLAAPGALVWLGAFVVFGAAFVAATCAPSSRRWVRWLLLGVQTAAALLLAQRSRGFEGAFFAIVAGQAAVLLSWRAALGWIAAQSAALAGIYLHRALSPGRAALLTLAYGGLQAFALGLASLAEREGRARRELARVNAELLATQAFLADSGRVAERLRISRELHDALGHHLTALSLHLEVASHLAEGKAEEHVKHAQEMARTLLAEVRGVVSTLRQEPPLDLAEVLRTLISGVPRPRVHLRLEGVPTDGPAVHALFRCAQEIITNAVRHSEAENLWLELSPRPGAWELSARDDGRGAPRFQPGSGLRGMQERLEQLGGGLAVAPPAGGGFGLRAWLRREEAP